MTLVIAWTILLLVGMGVLAGLYWLALEDFGGFLQLTIPIFGTGIVFAVIWALITVTR